MSAGVQSERCTGTSKRTGRQCGQFVPGGGVCRWHGRNAKAETNRQARIAVAEAVDLFGDRFAARPWDEALEASAALADQIVQALRSKVEMAGTFTMTELEALAQLAERSAKLQKLTQDSDLDSRRVRLAEQQGALVAKAIMAMLTDLGLNPTDPDVVRVVSRRLRELGE